MILVDNKGLVAIKKYVSDGYDYYSPIADEDMYDFECTEIIGALADKYIHNSATIISEDLNYCFEDVIDKANYNHISDIINDGYCYVWALAFKEIFEDAIIISACGHTFIKLKDMFYDSAMFKGTDEKLSISDSAFDENNWVIHNDINSLYERYGKETVDNKIDEVIKNSNGILNLTLTNLK